MPIEVRYFSDPACHWAWSFEPQLTRLGWEFAGEISLEPVMSGLAREFGPGYSDPGSGIPPGSAWDFALVQSWLEAAARSGMPVDARIWREAPPSGSYPACMAVVAAREQGFGTAMSVLRRLREALFCERRPVDNAEAISSVIGRDGFGRQGGSLSHGGPAFSAERFRVDLTSTATIEAFGADLAKAGELSDAAQVGGARPVLAADPDDSLAIAGPVDYDQLRAFAIEAGATSVNPGPLDPLDALSPKGPSPTGRLATAELVALAQRPRPVVEAELWRLATEWRIQPLNAPVATLWQLAG